MFVGSFNYDQRSLYLNTEIGLVFEQREIAERAAQKFDDNIEKIAFRVSLDPTDSDRRSLQWSSEEDGESVSYDTEPMSGQGQNLRPVSCDYCRSNGYSEVGPLRTFGFTALIVVCRFTYALESGLAVIP